MTSPTRRHLQLKSQPPDVSTWGVGSLKVLQSRQLKEWVRAGYFQWANLWQAMPKNRKSQEFRSHLSKLLISIIIVIIATVNIIFMSLNIWINTYNAVSSTEVSKYIYISIINTTDLFTVFTSYYIHWRPPIHNKKVKSWNQTKQFISKTVLMPMWNNLPRNTVTVSHIFKAEILLDSPFFSSSSKQNLSPRIPKRRSSPIRHDAR